MNGRWFYLQNGPSAKPLLVQIDKIWLESPDWNPVLGLLVQFGNSVGISISILSFGNVAMT